MKRLYITIMLLAWIAIFGGCDQQNITEAEASKEISIENLADSWTMKKLEVTDQADPSSTTDLVSLGFAAGTVEIDSAGSYSAVFNVLGHESKETGNVTIKQDSLIIHLDDSEGDKVYAVKLTDVLLTLSGEDSVDIDLDGVDEAVFAVMDLVRK